MSNIFITAANWTDQSEIATARLGTRFGRMDLSSQLALLAVEPLAEHFNSLPADRIALVINTRTGSLSTDVAYWAGHDLAGGLSPTLFIYTLPSSTIGELAIRHKITGPSLCQVGEGRDLIGASADLLQADEADAVICVDVEVISAALAALIKLPEAATARALLLQRNGPGEREWSQNDRDINQVFATLREQI